MADDVATEVELDGGFLVGHDGSTHADRAFRWAATWAARAGVPIHVVRAWSIMSAPRPPESFGYVPSMPEFEQAVREDLTARLAQCDVPDGLDVRASVVHGSPGARLIAASARADLLVVGPRGIGGFAGLMLGSVSEQCVRHAHCPVVVVRHEHEQIAAQ